jgi:ribosomal protein S18 acetylase RimI-like enzyme
MPIYTLTPIKNLQQALQLKDIRNQCKSFMTNDSSEIDFVRQIVWFYKVYKKENIEKINTCYLFKQEGKIVGFGVIRKVANKYWITGGLAKDQRGKGKGRVLFKELIKSTNAKEIWLEVLDSNTIAGNLYLSLGFKHQGKKNLNGLKISLMRLVKNK